jgi:uncharacterized membrane protein YfcA
MFARLLLLALAVFAIFYLAVLLPALARARREIGPLLSPASVATGFVTNFLDTLGIGSFATSTSVFKLFKMVPDELIPGTLFAGHTLPVIFQAFIYISAIRIDAVTLLLMVAAAAAGGWYGAGVVARLPRRVLRVAMAAALMAAAFVMLVGQLGLFPVGGTAIALRGWPLLAGVVGNFIFGALSTLGIGLYAPCMTLVSLLGMSPVAAFPIMMGSGAFLMPVAGVRFIWRKAYFAPMAAGLAAGGLVGVPIAAFLVKSLPLTALRYLAIIVAFYAAILMLCRSFTSPVTSHAHEEVQMGPN